MSKIDSNIDNLKDRIDPTNRRITIKNIEDTIECLNQFKEFIKLNTSSQILDYIEKLDKDTIDKFISYSKIYPSIIELDRNYDIFSLNTFEAVDKIITNASLIFKQDNEDFYFKDKDEKKTTNIETLIHLKNQINIQPKNNKKDSKEKKENDSFEIKCKKLLFFKEIISNLEVIYDKMKILRIKGCSLPILIDINIEYPTIKYKLNKKITDFEFIREYLFKAKNDYENQLNSIYKNEKYLRFLYGKLFRKIIMHLDGNCEISEIIRYILNKTDNNDEIQDGNIYNDKIAEDYVKEYKDYNKKSFENISKYVTSLFKNNKQSIKEHYSKMLIKEENRYKGIYLQKCENSSMEEFILYLFMDKLGQLPIAQNILFCNKETSIEEIQSFFYRAILCEYNTLFIVEIIESFSDFQYNKMFTYIDKLLSYKFEKSKKENKIIDKSRTKEYLSSCIVFIYDKNLENISFLNEKYLKQTLEINNFSNSLLNISFSRPFMDNIKVISSDVCGLGKSYIIKKMIKEEKLNYYHFPLGGVLTKKIIYEKILHLFKKIKKDNFEYKDIAIHLDLIESDETSLINEFLFSFLITKFYTNNEDIIYIPNNIKIYIEIPNCIENYLTKIGILNVFNIENIVLGELKTNEQKNITNIKKPKLELEQKSIKIFKKMNGYEKNEQIEEFIKKNIGIKEYSFHQVQTFIKLFISQFKYLEGKTFILESEQTIKCIEYFAKSQNILQTEDLSFIIYNKLLC